MKLAINEKIETAAGVAQVWLSRPLAADQRMRWTAIAVLACAVSGSSDLNALINGNDAAGLRTHLVKMDAAGTTLLCEEARLAARNAHAAEAHGCALELLAHRASAHALPLKLRLNDGPSMGVWLGSELVRLAAEGAMPNKPTDPIVSDDWRKVIDAAYAYGELIGKTVACTIDAKTSYAALVSSSKAVERLGVACDKDNWADVVVSVLGNTLDTSREQKSAAKCLRTHVHDHVFDCTPTGVSIVERGIRANSAPVFAILARLETTDITELAARGHAPLYWVFEDIEVTGTALRRLREAVRALGVPTTGRRRPDPPADPPQRAPSRIPPPATVEAPPETGDWREQKTYLVVCVCALLVICIAVIVWLVVSIRQKRRPL